MKLIKKNIINGTWKFKPKITLGQLAQFAEELTKDELYEKLYIRQTAKNPTAYGISFIYRSNHSDKEWKEVFDEYIHTTSDKIRRQFGNDLIGWDLSSCMFIIK